MKFVRTVFWMILLTSVLCVTGFVFVQMRVGEASKWILEEAVKQEVVIVPGASVLRSGIPSDILADRLLTAIELYETGMVKKILASGDGGSRNYNEVYVMRDYLLQAGVDSEDIFLDHAGFDSYDTMHRARDVFGVSGALVVSQEYHLPRLIYIGRSLGLDIYGIDSDRREYKKASFFKAREAFANIKAVLEVGIGSSPRFLGDPIDISGDGTTTH
jgi:SanA protein